MSSRAVYETRLPGVPLLARGKVRDVYDLGKHLLFVATDRLSAFDYVLPDPIPGKGHVLNQLSAFWFERLADRMPHHLVDRPTSNATRTPCATMPTSSPAARRSCKARDAARRVRRARLPGRLGLEGVPGAGDRLRSEAAPGPRGVLAAPAADLHAGDQESGRARREHPVRRRGGASRPRARAPGPGPHARAVRRGGGVCRGRGES